MTTSLLYQDGEGVGFHDVVGRLARSLAASGLVTDGHAGGVAQTLAETVAREMAVFYAILEQAHEAGYVDTAEGRALDNVVALLGVRRADPGLLRGRVTFSRLSPAPQDIVIRPGLMVGGPPLADGSALPLLETVEEATLRRGETAVSVAVQQLPDQGPSELGSIPPGAIGIMPRPLLGIEGVGNPEPITRGGSPENDDHLRARAMAVLREGQKGTASAIEAAVRALGIQSVAVEEAPEGRIGCIAVKVGDPGLERDPRRRTEVERAVRAAKAAGIHAEVRFLRSVHFRPTLTVEPQDPEMDEDAFRQLARSVAAAFSAFIGGHPAGVPLTRRKLDAAILADPAVRELELVMQTFLLEEGDEPAPVEDTGSRQLPDGGWYLGPLERAVADPAFSEKNVQRKPVLAARMELTVMVAGADLPLETLQQNVRAAVDGHVARLLPDREDGGRRLTLAGLQEALTAGRQVTGVRPPLVVHQADGLSERLEAGHDVVLAPGERLNVGRIDVVAASP